MKKHPRKLVLHRETLLELDRSSMKPVAGGANTGLRNSCPQVCEYSYPYRNTCNSCQQTCTTNLC